MGAQTYLQFWVKLLGSKEKFLQLHILLLRVSSLFVGQNKNKLGFTYCIVLKRQLTLKLEKCKFWP